MSTSPENNIVCISNSPIRPEGYISHQVDVHSQYRNVFNLNRNIICNEVSGDNLLHARTEKKQPTSADSIHNSIVNSKNIPPDIKDEPTGTFTSRSVLNVPSVHQTITEPLCLTTENNIVEKTTNASNSNETGKGSPEGTITDVGIDESTERSEQKICLDEVITSSDKGIEDTQGLENSDCSKEFNENKDVQVENPTCSKECNENKNGEIEIKNSDCNKEKSDSKDVESGINVHHCESEIPENNVTIDSVQQIKQLSNEVISLLEEAERECTLQQTPEGCSVSITSLKSALSTALQKEDKTYCCSECPWAFSSRTAQQQHLVRAHKKKPKNSGPPEERYKRNQRLKRSNVTYSRTKPFQCSICKSSFYERVQLIAHGLTHSKEKLLKCDVCELTFSKRKDFNSHALTHNKKPVACEICGKTFSQAGNMKIHLRIHTKEKPYTCEHCGKSYAQSGDLKTHIRVHTDEKPYLCEVCGNLFHSLSHLARHSKVHTKEKPYTCRVCEKSFAHTHHLKKHYRIHTQEKPYNCEICGKAFSRADYLKQHIRVHTKEKPYICKICGKGFSQGGSLKLHQRVHARQGLA